MARRGLSVSVFGRKDNSGDYNIVPRTPHSRSGRAEEGFTEEDLHDQDVASFARYREQQAEPLLASSTSASFPPAGYRIRGDEEGSKTAWWKQLTGRKLLATAPLLLGTIVAGILFTLIVISFARPGVLDAAIGYTGHATETPAQADNAVQPKPPVPSYVDTIPTPAHLISYSNYTAFPLTGAQYRHECNKLMGGKFMHHGTYWEPPPGGIMDVSHHDDVTDYHLPEGESTRVCTKTITYQLDGNVGLVADLALMAQAAALAREQNRTFLIDDTYWNRGSWTDHFQDVRSRQPGPEPGCRAPPPQELVACPRFARHWVINSRTALYHFTHAFSEEYEDPFQEELNRLRPIFDKSLQSLQETIRPNAQNGQLIRAARSELSAALAHSAHTETPVPPTSDPSAKTAEELLHMHNPDPYIAVHIRRGDRKAHDFPYRDHYVPLQDFVQVAYGTWVRLYHYFQDAVIASSPVMYVASDSPTVAYEFASALPPSTAIFSLQSSSDSRLRELAPHNEYVQSEFDKLSEEERVKLTRGMVVDLAMVSGLWAWHGDAVPGGTVCTLSSNVCKIAAVGLGWNRAFGFEDGQANQRGEINEEKKRWVELDNKGTVSPVWTAFEVAA